MIPFGEWLPDLGDLNNPGTIVAKNVIPTADGYKPAKKQAVISDALTAYARGAISVIGSDGSVYVYAGDATKLYSFDGSTWTDVTRLSGGNYSSNARWQFIEWGEKVIATNNVDTPQIITLGDANFADLSGTPPVGRAIAQVRDFVVFGDTLYSAVRNKKRVHWSGFGDETAWPTIGSVTAASQQSDEQVLQEGGPIQNIIGGTFGYVFQRNAIQKMTYEGPPTIFRFDVIEDEKGALCPGGIVDAGQGIFYIGLDGFYMLSQDKIANISDQKVTKTFFADLQSDYLDRVSCTVDKSEATIRWAYPGSSSVGGAPDTVLIYHWPTQRWSTSSYTQADSLFNYIAPAPGATVDSDTSAVDDSIEVVDSDLGSAEQASVGSFDSAFKLAPLSGSAKDATIETLEIGGDRRILVTGFRPYITDHGTVTVVHKHRDSLSSTPTSKAPVNLEAHGKASLRQDARYHRFEVNITGGFDVAQGGDEILKPAGNY